MTRRYTAKRPPFLVLGSIAATGLALSACGDDPPQEVLFASAEQCIQGGFDAEVCNAEYQDALQRHTRDAPRFNDQAACETEFGPGKCLQTQDQNGTSFFLPFLAGYVVSSAIQNLSYSGYNSYRRSNGYSSTPIYTNRTGATYTSNRPTIGQPPQSRPFNVNTRTVSRQGFGGSSSGRGFSFGG